MYHRHPERAYLIISLASFALALIVAWYMR